MLTGDLETMAALHAADPVTVHRINLGGIHHAAGRRERLPYLYLTDEEMTRLAALEAAGAAVVGAGPPDHRRPSRSRRWHDRSLAPTSCAAADRSGAPSSASIW